MRNNKIICTNCGKRHSVTRGSYYLHIPRMIDGELVAVTELVCFECWKALTTSTVNLAELKKQIKYNERWDRNINAIVPTNKR